MFGSSLSASSAYRRFTKKYDQLWLSASISPILQSSPQGLLSSFTLYRPFVHVTKHELLSTEHLPTCSPRSYGMTPFLKDFFATKTKLLSLVLQTTFLDSKRWLTMIISKMFLVLQECRKQRLFYETPFLFFAVSHSHFSSTNHWNKKILFHPYFN